MTEETTSQSGVLNGVLLGILLLPAALIVEYIYLSDGSMAALNVPFHAVLFFGVVQAFGVLPAALLFYARGKHGVVRGLLYFGIFAALSNVWLWIFVYRGFFNAPIY